MSLPMYDAAIPVLERTLHNLKHILRKGEAHAEAQGYDPDNLLAARLYPDMFPLRTQVVIASDIAKACPFRLAGQDVPSFPDSDDSFEALHGRIDRVLVALKDAQPDAINGSDDRIVTLKIRGNEVQFPGNTYLQAFVLPNVYFHVTTAYNILRHNGVPLGKMDFLGSS